jgi:hypothetical protein
MIVFRQLRLSQNEQQKFAFTLFLLDRVKTCNYCFISGNQFALVASKLVLVHLLSRFNIRVTAKTPLPMKIIQTGFNMSVEGGFWFGLELRSS